MKWKAWKKIEPVLDRMYQQVLWLFVLAIGLMSLIESGLATGFAITFLLYVWRLQEANETEGEGK